MKEMLLSSKRLLVPPFQGDLNLGYYGVVNDIVSYGELAALLNITEGTNTWASNEWFKFVRKGKILYIPKYPVRQNVSWDYLNSLDLVYGRIININGKAYNIRLIRGSNSLDPNSATLNYSGVINPLYSDGSEWNDLMYRVVSTTIPGSDLPKWELFDPNVVVLGNRTPGSSTPCMDSNGTDCIFRGFESVSYYISRGKASSDDGRGYRPVLEPIN